MNTNGHAPTEASYFCSNCGHWLCASTVPLGSAGHIRIQCTEDGCGRMNLIAVGGPPLPRADRDAWILQRRMQRQRATSF